METEQLKPEELDMHVKNGTFRLAFIGMSNAGKSYRSKVLRDELDFFWYHVDGEIMKALGFEKMDEISAWLGEMSSPTFKKREAEYLRLENQCTKVDDLDTGGKNLVFDTTGSVIELKEDTLSWLRDECLIVNIKVSEKKIEELKKKYTDQPKPVVWGDIYEECKKKGCENDPCRCYEPLLTARLGKYEKLAHLSIPIEELFDTSGQETLEIIKKYL